MLPARPYGQSGMPVPTQMHHPLGACHSTIRPPVAAAPLSRAQLQCGSPHMAREYTQQLSARVLPSHERTTPSTASRVGQGVQYGSAQIPLQPAVPPVMRAVFVPQPRQQQACWSAPRYLQQAAQPPSQTQARHQRVTLGPDPHLQRQTSAQRPEVMHSHTKSASSQARLYRPPPQCSPSRQVGLAQSYASSPAVPSATQCLSARGTTRQAESVELREGVQVVISGRSFMIVSPLGMGSYGMVWRGTCQQGSDVAIKEIICRSDADLANAHFEADLLQRLGTMESLGKRGSSTSASRMPTLIAQETHTLGQQQWRVRLAMSRIPGVPLTLLLEQRQSEATEMNSFSRDVYASHEVVTAIVRFVAEPMRFALELVVQLGPALHSLSSVAYHRDVNSRNIMIDCGETSLNYGLVDFGMAVDSCQWCGDASIEGNRGAWEYLEVGGDCRYWPVSAWVMFLRGPQELLVGSRSRSEYKQHLDLHALGLTSMQVFVELLPSSLPSGGQPHNALLQSLQAVLASWKLYWKDASEHWLALIECFRNSGDWNALKIDCIERGVLEIVSRNLSQVRAALSQVKAACSVTPSAISNQLETLMSVLLAMLSDGMSDESNDRASVSWSAAFATLGVGDPTDGRPTEQALRRPMTCPQD